MQAAVHHDSSDSNTISTASLSPAQARVIAALAQGRTVTDAARDAGIHRTTIHHWFRNEPIFKTAFQEAQREYSETLHDGMRVLAAHAVDALHKLIDDPNTSPALRLRTAVAILDRPHLQKEGSQPSEPVESPVQQDDIGQLTEIERREQQPPPSAPIARGAPCPCGSGNKYKRCCGSSSPGKFTLPRKPRGVAA